MNWDQVEGKWKQAGGKVKEKWGKLTDDDFQAIAGKRDQLGRHDSGALRRSPRKTLRVRWMSSRALTEQMRLPLAKRRVPWPDTSSAARTRQA